MSENSIGCLKGNFYKIGKGETLFGISVRFGMDIAELLSANPYLDPNYYVPGQTIVIPYACSIRKHTISDKETLADVLRRFDTDAKTLRRLNPMQNMLELKDGMEINVPDLPQNINYIIKETDTLSGIAQRFGTDVVEILKRNPNLRPAEFVSGQGIRV